MSTDIAIPFSPPDITDEEIAEVVDTLKSGWITTGPKVKELERRLSEFCHTPKTACVSSATAALECALRVLGIGPGDEVITSAYTYTASCSVICHVGATPVLCDTAPNSFEMDYSALKALITPKTKAIIPVDLAGRMVDYDALFDVVESAKASFVAASPRQEALGRVAIIADSAHALGAVRQGAPAGSVADLTAFSFHAVKNFTTAEGGALTWRADTFDDEALYTELMLWALHGQTKDALAKTKAGAWEYDIAFPGYKCNMTDIQAALGLVQLKRYPQLLARRRELVSLYLANLDPQRISVLRHYENGEGADDSLADDAYARTMKHGYSSSGHLLICRLPGKTQAFRNALIEEMAKRGVTTNVHYKPLPLLSAYRNLGFEPADFPHAMAQFENEITLPLHTLLSNEDVVTVCRVFDEAYTLLDDEGIA